MTHTNEQERAEFEAWAESVGLDHLDRGFGKENDYAFVETRRMWAAWQAARRAQVVPPDQLSPEAAKRAMEELQTEVEALRQSLAECRDAFPMPEPGAPLECEWMQAIGHAEAVPDYVKACLRVPVLPQALCVICGSDEPYTGTCGSNDPRALCKKPAPQPPEADHIADVGNMVPKADMGIPISQQNQQVASPVECACGDSYQADSFGAGFIAARGKCPNCDASEAAPVQMPEPVAWMLGFQTMGGDVGWKLSWSKSGAGVCHRLNGEEFEQPLYTEHQVRYLLAAQQNT